MTIPRLDFHPAAIPVAVQRAPGRILAGAALALAVLAADA